MKPCPCYNCAYERDADLPIFEQETMTRMIVCETCGNKRCPHSTDHKLACTNSNEPGQPGSRYGGLPADGAGRRGPASTTDAGKGPGTNNNPTGTTHDQ